MNGKERRVVNDSSESICNDREREIVASVNDVKANKLIKNI